MVREPEMIFWVFVFPLLMALALGIAFRSPSEAPVAVAVEPGVGAAELVDILSAHESVEIVPVASRRDGDRAARRARACRRRARRSAAVPLRPDPAGEPAGAPDRRRPAAARRGPQGCLDRPRRGRHRHRQPLHRLADSRSARNEHHGDRHVGRRIHAGGAAHPQAAQAADRDADAAPPVPGRPRRRAPRAARTRGGGAGRLRPPDIRRADRGLAASPSAPSRCSGR